MKKLDIEGYEQRAIAYMDEDGFPAAVPAQVEVQGEEVIVRPAKGVSIACLAGKKVNVVLNHIRPLPSGGYADRSYVVLVGVAETEERALTLRSWKAYGWSEARKPFPEYVEVSTHRARTYLRQLGKRLGVDFKPRIGALWTFMRVLRFPFLSAMAASVAVGAAIALYKGLFSLSLTLLTFLGLALLHLALNVANDYFDTLLGADTANTRPTPFSGGSRSIIYGLVSVTGAKQLYLSLFALGSAIGVYLAWSRGLLEIIALGLTGLFLAYFYTAPPLKLSYRGLGELAVAIGFGPLVVLGTYLVQARAFSPEVLAASLPTGVLIALILYVNEIPDAPFDRAAGKRQLVARLSKDEALRLLVALFAFAYTSMALLPFLGLGPPTAWMGLLTTPLAALVYRRARESFEDQYAMIPIMALNIKNSILTCLLLAAGYALWPLLGA
ncbi:MAG: 1,4-dihydroxy-2-naphthoate octaprenyltransferase [Nitrososphaerota archaeon]